MAAGRRVVQLSYGCVEVHFADWSGLGNGLQGLKEEVRDCISRLNRLILAKPRPPRARGVGKTTASPPDQALRR